MDRRKRSLVVGFCFWLIMTTLSAQDSGLSNTEEKMVRVENATVLLDSNIVNQGTKFNLTVVFPLRFNARAVFTPLGVFPPAGFQLLEGPMVRIISANPLTNTGSQVSYSYLLEATQVGAWEIPPFQLQSGEEISQSETLSMHVQEMAQHHSQIEPELVWSYQLDQVYIGQSFLLELNMMFMPEEVLPRLEEFPRINGALVENVRITRAISPQLLDNEQLYNIPVASWMITPERAGLIKLPPVSVSIGDKKFKSQASEITIKNHPYDNSDFAIGQFKLSSHLDENNIQAKDTVNLTIRLEGVGNFNTFNLPEPIFGLLEVMNRQERRNLIATSRGYEGAIELVFKLNAPHEGRFRITLPAFNSWDPFREQTVLIPTSSHLLYVEALPQSIIYLPFIEQEKLRFSPNASIFRQILLFLPLFLILAFVLWYHRSPQKKSLSFFNIFLPLLILFYPDHLNQPLIHAAYQAINEQQWNLTQELFAQSEHEFPRFSAALAYNQAAASQRMGNLGETIYHLHRARQSDPFNERYTKAIYLLTQNSYYAQPSRLRLLQIVWFVGAWLSIIALFILGRNKKCYRILSSLFLIFCLFTVGGWFYQLPPTAPIAITKIETELFRIPDPIAGKTASVPAGTVFFIKERWRDYLFLSSKEGSEGWLESDALYIVE
jgi:hypothetical protein